MENRLIKKSKQLSWLLRHGAHAQGLAMDEAGWMEVDELLTFFSMTRAELKLIVDTNDKRRLQWVDGRIRACQGHSLDNRAVTREALEASWSAYIGDGSLWHGTTVDATEQIAREGILPITRTHVHCAPSRDSMVGKRAAVALLLEISPIKIREADFNLFIAPNGVVLVRHVPTEAIVGLAALTKKAKQREAELRASLGLVSVASSQDQ